MSGYNLYISNYLKKAIQALDLTSTDELKSKLPSLPWNLELSTWNSRPVPELVEGFPSVSPSSLILSNINKLPGDPKHDPG